ncbi:ribbon-helix-helix domain-containing protein [Azospirillum brasilense]|uniref:ribbon-helix-helix domain-containing protein n=1 Tax=Azospirillum brasilense TaxID=192 RepID=UPI0009A3DAF6|nr:ribbon-helix-helix domain-containing protein [Azospirillum brasilense]
MKDIAQSQGKSLEALCAEIHDSRTEGIPFATSVRVYVLNHFRSTAAGSTTLVA